MTIFIKERESRGKYGEKNIQQRGGLGGEEREGNTKQRGKGKEELMENEITIRKKRGDILF